MDPVRDPYLPHCKMAVRELEKHGAALRKSSPKSIRNWRRNTRCKAHPLLVNQGDTLNKIVGFGPIRAFIRQQGM